MDVIIWNLCTCFAKMRKQIIRNKKWKNSQIMFGCCVWSKKRRWKQINKHPTCTGYISLNDKRIHIHIVCRKTLRAAFLSSLTIQNLATVVAAAAAAAVAVIAQTFSGCADFITPQLNLLTTIHPPKRTFLGEKTYIMLHELTNPQLVCYEFSTEWSFWLESLQSPCNTNTPTHRFRLCLCLQLPSRIWSI